mgnify:CR=1 FL=1
MDFDTQFFVSTFPKLMLKIPYTLCLGCVAFAIAFVLGLFLEICFTSRFKILRTLAGLYISYFRSTPYITQLFIFYFGLPQIISCYEKSGRGNCLGHHHSDEFCSIYFRGYPRGITGCG